MSKGSSGGGAGVGGGSAASSGAGAATAASTASSTHNVPLPKDPKRMTVDTASSAMQQMGYKIDIKSGQTTNAGTSYNVRQRDGSEKRMTIKEIRKTVYDGKA